MTSFLINYDLKSKQRSHYGKIYQKLAHYEYHFLQQSMYIVNTTKTLDEVRNDFKSCFDQKDRFCIIPMTDDLNDLLN